jgi:hypothetical protein
MVPPAPVATPSPLLPGEIRPGANHHDEIRPDENHQILAALARASSPAERRAGGWLRPVEGADERAEADRRFARWAARVAGPRAERLPGVLAELGCTHDQWRRALTDVEVVPEGERPDWADDAVRLLAMSSDADGDPAPRLRDVAGDGLPSWVDGDQPWRFHAGFAGWLAAARRDVAGWTQHAPLTEAARSDLVLDLARRQLAVCGPLLMSAAAGRPATDPLFGTDPRGDWERLFVSHPVAARLLAVIWRQWRTTTAELVERVRADLPALRPGLAVRRVDQSAGDQHDQGRGVARLRLTDGSSLFLKPRADRLGGMLATVLHQVEQVGAPIGWRLPDVVERPGYAWVAEVAAGDCVDDAAVTRYVYRAGALLRVLQALGATDLHHENFVPTADGPVLIDLETVVSPGPLRTTGPADAPASDPVAERLDDTPGPTSMVTSVVAGPPGRGTADIGALAGPSAPLTPYPVRTLVPGPGGPEVRSTRTPMPTGAALPRRDGSPVALRGHEQALLDGFTDVQTRLAALADTDLLGGVEPAPTVRFVARPTRTYARLLQQSTTPEALRDGVERELVLAGLHRATGSVPPGLICAEISALRDLDVPLFTVAFGSTDLAGDAGTLLPDALAESPADRTRRRLRAVTRRHDQVDDLRATLFCLDPRLPSSAPAAPPPTRGPTKHPTEDTTGDPTQDPCEHLLAGEPLRLVLDRAITLPDGTVTWVGLEHDPNRSRWTFGRVSAGLTGQAGIALALAQLADRPGGGPDGVRRAPSGCAEAARAAVLGSVDRIGSGHSGPADGYAGPAGVLYAAAWVARLLADDTLRDAARTLVDPCLRAARRAEPSSVLDGVAGAILALLQLPSDPPREDALTELATLLARSEPHELVDPPDPWAQSLPSRAAGRLLARHRLAELRPVQPGGTSGGRSDGDQIRVDRDPQTAGDAVVATLLTRLDPPEPLPDEVELTALLDRSALLDAALVHRWGSAAAEDPAGRRWWAARARVRDEALRRRRRTGRWWATSIAPDATLVSPVHGLPALAVLCAEPGSDVPIARALS